MRKVVVAAGLGIGILALGQEASAFCPSSLQAVERTQCQVQESAEWAQRQNDQQNLRTFIEDQQRLQQTQERSQQQWQQHFQQQSSFDYRRR